MLASGVPLITQVELLIEAQEGSDGETVQFEIAAPFALKVDGVIVLAAPTMLAPLTPT